MTTDSQWQARQHYQESCTTYRTVWDIYMKFYTVFLTTNVVGVGLVVQHVETRHRWPIVLAFLIQNLASSVTAFQIAIYSRGESESLSRLARAMTKEGAVDSQSTSPLPGLLASKAAIVNLVSHLALCLCWIPLPWIPK